MAETIIKALFEYFGDCPLLTDSRLNIEYLPAGASPADEVISSYMRRGERCRYPFILSIFTEDDPDVAQNMADSGFGEKAAAWLRDQTRQRTMPILPDDLTPRGIRAFSSGSLHRSEDGTQHYRIQCELDYYRKGD